MTTPAERPRKKLTALRIEPELYARIQRIAEAEERPASAVFRRLVRQRLDQLDENGVELAR